MAPRETFGQTLKQIRLGKAMTQRQVARNIGMDFSYYSRLECDRVGPPMRDTVLELAKGLNASEDERNDLLATAGRVGEEMQEQPLLKHLYTAAARLPEEDLADLVRRAEEKGHVPYPQEGARSVYSPTHPPQKVAQHALTQFVQTFFGGSAEKVVAALVSNSDGRLSDAELDRLAVLIEQARVQEE